MREQLTALNSWRVLNDLRTRGSRLVYNGDGYRTVPNRTRVTAGEMATLLGLGYIRELTSPPAGVYVLTDAGLAAWARPPAIITGACDKCGAERDLRPVPAGNYGELLCETCAGAAAVAATRTPWTCDKCGQTADSLTVWSGGERLCRGCSARRLSRPRGEEE